MVEIQELLYRMNVISRPFGSQLGQTEPTTEEKMAALLNLGLLKLEYPIGGADVSRWQGMIDWGKFESELYFVFIQSSYGAAGIDSGFKINLAAVQKRNVAYGLYHYLKPGNDAIKTATLFHTLWKDSGSQLPPAFDLEQNDGLSVKDLNNWMEKVIKTFNDKAGKEVVKTCYSSANFINTYVMKTPTYDWLKILDFWVANWTTATSPLLPIVFNLFAKPKTWQWWQYSSKGDGKKYGMSSPALDLDYSCLPTLVAFNLKYGTNLVARPVVPVPPPPPPPPPPGDDTPLGKMWCHTAGGIRVRSGPGTQFPIIGALAYKDIVTPIEIGGDNAWVEIAPGKWACATQGQYRYLEKLSPEDQAFIDGPDSNEKLIS